MFEAVNFSRQRAYLDPPQDHGGFLQIDDEMEFDEQQRQLVKIAGEPIDMNREYKIGLLALSLNGMNRNQPLIDWANAHQSKMPKHEDMFAAKDLLVRTCSELLLSQMDISRFDKDSSGYLDAKEIQEAIGEILGGQEVPPQIVENLMRIVDADNDGRIDAVELDSFIKFFKHVHSFQVHDTSGCNLRIIQCNDVYELHNWPSYDGLIRHHTLSNTITILPGDFLAPSLLSSLDRGKGMVDCMNRVGGCGIQYVCFGNHETDVPFAELKKRIAEYKGVWVNSNMPDFETKLPEYTIIEIQGGGQKRRVGLIGLLTTDKNLYQPGAFGGAMETALPVCETAAKLRQKLIDEEHCDIVIPMTHQAMADDREMASMKMGFPLICGAHDHVAYMEQVEGAWIVKAGMDANNALIIDINWPTTETKGEEPTISVELVPTDAYPADPQLVEVVHKHMQVVEEMESAYLYSLPSGMRLSSKEMRRKQTTVGTLLTSLIRDGFRLAAGAKSACEGVVMDAGAIRRNYDYPANYQAFTYGDLKKEIPFESEMVVVSMRGTTINAAVQFSRERAFRDPPEDWGGFLQLDDGFVWDEAERAVTHINHQPLDPERKYQVAFLALSLNGMNRNQPLIEWTNSHPDVDPAGQLHAPRPPNVDVFKRSASGQWKVSGAQARQAKDLVVESCAKQVWRQLGSFDEIDKDQDGVISIEEVREAMEQRLQRTVSDVDARNLVVAIDRDGSGDIDRDEFLALTASVASEAPGFRTS